MSKTEIIEACGTFGAIHKAQKTLEAQGYVVGPLCGSEPVGFADATKYSYVAKWRNIPMADRKKLAGIIISKDFREGSVKILWAT